MITLKGVPGSPYTRKMLALLRYRRLPYRLLLGDRDVHNGMPAPKVRLLPIFYFEGDNGEMEAVVDSTPIIRRLEVEHPGRSVLAANPVICFLDYLLEDYADEWLTKPMFHYRWQYDADIKMAGDILPYWADITAPQDDVDERSRQFVERQIGRLYVVGSSEKTASVIEASYRRFLSLLSKHLESYPFLMGHRPGASDFAVHGELTVLAHFDPTPSKLTLELAPRVYAWVGLMEDQSGLEPQEKDWISPDAIPQTLIDLLKEMGRTYVPVMLANDEAYKAKQERVETSLDGQPWVQQTFPYQSRCLGWIRDEYDKLSPADQNTVSAILEDTGCETLIK